MMDDEICADNFDLLRNLPSSSGAKLVVHKSSGALSLDDRWLVGVRRYTSGDSRVDLIQPLRITLGWALKHVNNADVARCLDDMETSFKIIYPDFQKLYDLINEIRTELAYSAQLDSSLDPQLDPQLDSSLDSQLDPSLDPSYDFSHGEPSSFDAPRNSKHLNNLFHDGDVEHRRITTVGGTPADGIDTIIEMNHNPEEGLYNDIMIGDEIDRETTNWRWQSQKCRCWYRCWHLCWGLRHIKWFLTQICDPLFPIIRDE